MPEPAPEPLPPPAPSLSIPPTLPVRDQEQRRAVVVLGMHRSGTSAVAGCLQRLGVDFGPRLMPPTPDNARGFYEHIDIVNLHDRLLLAAGSSWDDTEPRPPHWLDDEALTSRFRDDLRALLKRDFAGAPLWGIKDPRLCRLLPWWQPLWAEIGVEPCYVIVLRDPREVVSSLTRRDGFSAGKGYLLWLQYILEAERATRGTPRVFIDFAAFLADWREALKPVGASLGFSWPLAPAPAGSPPQMDEDFVDHAMARAVRFPAEGMMPPWVAAVDTALRLERTPADGSSAASVLDGIANQLEDAHSLFGQALTRAEDLSLQLTALRQQAQWYEAEWQKARKRMETESGRSEKRRSEALSLKSRIINLESRIANMRNIGVSDVRILRGGLWRFLRRCWPF